MNALDDEEKGDARTNVKYKHNGSPTLRFEDDWRARQSNKQNLTGSFTLWVQGDGEAKHQDDEEKAMPQQVRHDRAINKI